MKAFVYRIHDKFYRWYDRMFPERSTIIDASHTRRHLRDAYEAGYRLGRLDCQRKQTP